MQFKRTGYDALIVRGRAENPVMIEITADGVAIKTRVTCGERVGSKLLKHLVRIGIDAMCFALVRLGKTLCVLLLL